MVGELASSEFRCDGVSCEEPQSGVLVIEDCLCTCVRTQVCIRRQLLAAEQSRRALKGVVAVVHDRVRRVVQAVMARIVRTCNSEL